MENPTAGSAGVKKKKHYEVRDKQMNRKYTLIILIKKLHRHPKWGKKTNECGIETELIKAGQCKYYCGVTVSRPSVIYVLIT